MKTIKTTMVPLNIDNVDTDQIIPARFLKKTTREGFGAHLFNDWRFDREGNEIIDFILNNKKYNGSVLVTGNNFGCGSSREHAAWSISDYGFKAIISTQFADIFKNNALNNGILPIEVRPEILEMIFNGIEWNSQLEISVDLESQTLEIEELAISQKFEIDEFKKLCLMEGINETQFLINMRADIEAFETTKA